MKFSGLGLGRSSSGRQVADGGPGAVCQGLPASKFRGNIGALRITYTILGVPYYSYSIIYPETLF